MDEELLGADEEEVLLPGLDDDEEDEVEGVEGEDAPEKEDEEDLGM